MVGVASCPSPARDPASHLPAPLTSGAVLLASPAAGTTVTAAATPSSASATAPTGLGAGGPGLGSAGPAGCRWGHSLSVGGRGARVVTGSWAGLGAQGTWWRCGGGAPIVARGGAQGRGGGRGPRGVGGWHSWGLGVLAAVDRLGAVFGWRLQRGEHTSGASGSANPLTSLISDLLLPLVASPAPPGHLPMCHTGIWYTMPAVASYTASMGN